MCYKMVIGWEQFKSNEQIDEYLKLGD